MSIFKRIEFLIVFFLSSLTVSATIDSVIVSTSKNTICYDSCNGWAIVDVYSATSVGPFEITWRGNGIPGLVLINTTTTSDTLFDLCAGNFSVEVRDLSDASKVFPKYFTIARASKVNALVFGYTILNCHNSTNGMIAVTGVGGSPPYHYQWSTGPNDTLSQLTGLSAGKYSIVIKDNNGCTETYDKFLMAPDSLRVNLTVDKISCKNMCDGVVAAHPSGGTAPYSYIWSSSDTVNSINNLCPGKYLVTVTDSKNCMTTDSVILTEPDSLLASFDIISPKCNGNCDGEVTSIATGGTRPFNYHWSSYSVTDSTLANVCPGVVTATVSDANGCFYVKNVSVSQPSKLKVQPTINSSTCGVCDGDISIAVSGGSGNYKYLWLGQKAEDTLTSIDSLCPAIYRVAITDDSLCTDTFSIALSDDTSGIKDILFTFSESSCPDVCDGAILATQIGGTGPFTYLWSPGAQTDSVLTGQCPGNYSVLITDAANCKRVELVNLVSASNMNVSYSSTFNGCQGDCESEISLTVTNGLGPYSFFWPGIGTTSSNIGNLCSGSYPFKVTDANNCAYKDTVLISEPDTISISLISMAETCFESCNGFASVTFSGGKPPYSVNWSNGSITTLASGLCSGSYWVEITDANGCSNRKNFVLVSPTKIQSNPTIYDSQCNFGFTGSIKLNPTGGTAPYRFYWAPFNGSLSLGDSIYGLNASSYSVLILDTNNCARQDTFVVSDENGPEFNVTVQNESCPNECDGQINISTSGINGPIQYIWNSPLTGSSTSPLSGNFCPGNYNVGITAGGCTTFKQAKIKKAKDLFVTFDISQPKCVSSCDGSIIAHVSGGNPPYNLVWSNSSNSDVLSNLCAGTYTLTISDAAGCFKTDNVDLTNPQAISITLSTSNLTCYNVCDGVITSSITGGTAPYSYLWSNGSTTSSTNNLCEGIYWLQVTDANGCTNTKNIALANGVPISATFNKTSAGCGKCDGILSVTASAGNGLPYTYQWSTGDTTNSTSNLSAGLYTVDISDNLGCSQSFTTSLSNAGGPSLTDLAYPVSCFGSCDGSSKAVASVTSPPYFFQWFDPLMQTGDSASNLCPGVYNYSSTDAAGCLSFDSVVIIEPEPLINNPTITGISCPGQSDAVIQSNLTGAVGPVTYSWSNGDNTSFTDSLAPGIYSVLATDSLGCSTIDSIDILPPTAISISLLAINSSCFGTCNGKVIATVSGGAAPYTYSWNDPMNQTTPIAADLCVGYIKLTITDSKGCIKIDSALVPSPSPISATPTLSNPTCFKGNNGSISLLISGGSSPYQVNWNNGMTGAVITGLRAGSYNATIIDKNNCVYQNSYILNSPAQLTLTINVTKPSCNNNNGSAAVIASGGSGSYSFSWNTIPTKTTSTITALWAGKYEVTVTDNNTGCSQTKEIILGNAGAKSLTFDVLPELCPGTCNGTATVHAGPGNFTYQWDDPAMQTDSSAIALCQGLYTVMVTDTLKCISIDTISLHENDFKIDLLDVKAVQCDGVCDGSITVQPSGGLPPYTYNWLTIPPLFTQTIDNLCPMVYSVTVTDSLLCSTSLNVNVPKSNPGISFSLDILKNISCSGTCTGRAKVNISGGSKPYKIFWNGKRGTEIGYALCPGNNVVEVYDAFDNCSASLSFIMDDAIPILANAVISLPACGEYNGSIILNPTGGNGPYYYNWSNGAHTSFISNLFAGIYSVDITDANGCIKNFSFFLNNPNAPALVFDHNTVKCNGDCNGVARVTPLGGVNPYTYLWNNVPVSTLDSLTGLCSGVYFVKVTDATACISFGADTITEPAILIGNLNKIKDGCGGLCEGEAIIIPTGGTMPYNYTWNSSPPQNLATATGLCAGMVTILLTDANDCLFEDSVEIIPAPELVIDSLEITNASCFTNADGEVTVYFTGGTVPVLFTWSNSQTTQTATALNNGIYTVVLTDNNNCNAFDTAYIGVQDSVLVTAFVDSFVCIGSSVMLKAKGIGADFYNWFTDSSGFLTAIGSGDSLLYVVEDTVTIYLRGENNVSPPCFDIDTGYIIGIPPPLIVAGTSTPTIEEGNATQLFASPYLFNGFYAWWPSGSLNDTTSIAPIAIPEKTTTYVITGTSEFGCIGSDSITITVLKNDEIINGFSPNGDGVNDVWEIPLLKDYPDVIVEVYNRWGIQVFRSDGYKKPWDGKYEGSLLPNSSYYYVIDFYGDGKKVETGAVTILF